MKEKFLSIVFYALFFVIAGYGQVVEQQNKLGVQPKLALKGAVSHTQGDKQYHKVILTITNKNNFSQKMFELAESEKLPPNPCGEKLTARVLMAIYAEDGKQMAGCLPIPSTLSLDAPSFLIEKGTYIPEYVYVVITDRKTGTNYKSNLVSPSTGRIKDTSAPMKSITGTVKGTIDIKNVSGNNLGNFTCGNLKVSAGELKQGGWLHSSAATGDFAARKCSYTIPNVPVNSSFTVGVSANFPQSCDQKTFNVTASFPMEIKPQETLTYNALVQQISCTLVK